MNYIKKTISIDDHDFSVEYHKDKKSVILKSNEGSMSIPSNFFNDCIDAMYYINNKIYFEKTKEEELERQSSLPPF